MLALTLMLVLSDYLAGGSIVMLITGDKEWFRDGPCDWGVITPENYVEGDLVIT